MILLFSTASLLVVVIAKKDPNWQECSPDGATVPKSGLVENLQELAKKAVRVNVAVTMIMNFLPPIQEDVKCSGVLITKKHVLTAADCFNGDNDTSRYKVRIGNTNFREGASYSIKKIKIHEKFRSGKFYDDLAILTLSDPVPDAHVICLPNQRMTKKKLSGLGATVADWGNKDAELSSSTLYLASVRILSNKECNQNHVKMSKIAAGDGISISQQYFSQFSQGITPSLLCARHFEGGEQMCTRTSGGPLMFLKDGRWYIIGITVEFSKGCQSDIIIKFTRVSSYVDWIKKNIN